MYEPYNRPQDQMTRSKHAYNEFMSEWRQKQLRSQDTLCPQCAQSDCDCQSEWANNVNRAVRRIK
jgi:hypothetical protein